MMMTDSSKSNFQSIDWQKISSIDPCQIALVEESTQAAVEEVVNNIAFCSLEEEFGRDLMGGGITSPNLQLLKLCRVMQLAVLQLHHKQVYIISNFFLLVFLLFGFTLFSKYDSERII